MLSLEAVQLDDSHSASDIVSAGRLEKSILVDLAVVEQEIPCVRRHFSCLSSGWNDLSLVIIDPDITIAGFRYMLKGYQTPHTSIPRLRSQQTFSNLFRLNRNGVGSSLKVSTNWRSSKVTQIEYSACFGNESDVDCGPSSQKTLQFSQYGNSPAWQW